jgi:hypothetical protein
MQERFDGWWLTVRDTFITLARIKPVPPPTLALWAYKAGYELGWNNAKHWIRGLSVRAFQEGYEEARKLYAESRQPEVQP